MTSPGFGVTVITVSLTTEKPYLQSLLAETNPSTHKKPKNTPSIKNNKNERNVVTWAPYWTQGKI